MSQLLTNNVNTGIVLTLNNVNSSDSNVISLDVGESILYDSVVVTNTLDPNYNVDLIQEYIDAGILLEETLSATHNSEVRALYQSNITLNLTSGIPEITANVNAITDNLQTLPVVDSSGNILCIYYKSVQGMLISTDLGVTQTLISNDNLIFPDEITSFAAQVYDSYNGILHPVKRLFIGTLREGVKTFTPGVDLTYVNFEPNAGVGSNGTDSLFQYTTTTTVITEDESNVQYPTGGTNVNGIYYPPSPKVTNTFTGFCPTFVLAIINTPSNSGCPIFIASRVMHTDSTTTTIINSVTGAISSPVTITNSPVYKTKIVFKYLHNTIYKNNLPVNTVLESQFATHDDYLLFLANNNWTLIQENTTPGSITNIITSALFPQDVMDIITEYTAFGAIFVVKQVLSAGISNRLFRLTCSQDMSDLPAIDEIPLYALIDSKIRNMSYLEESGAGTWSIFITTDTSVYRYSSINEDWINFIYASNPVGYLSTNVQNGILNPSGSSSLSGLSNFILVPKSDVSNNYVGLLGTEIGLIFYDLVLKNNVYATDIKSGRVLLNNITKAQTTDIKTVANGRYVYAFICSYEKQLLNTYFNNQNCMSIVSDKSSLTQTVMYVKPAVVSITDSPYYVNTDTLYINSVFSAEQVSYNPVLINNTYTYTNLHSPKYTFKLNTLQQDTIFITALLSILAHKYYFAYFTERIISSKNKIELNILQLNEFKHIFKVGSINSINAGIDTGTAIVISNQNQVILPTYIDNGPTDLKSIVCIRSDGKVIIPTSITQTIVQTTQYQTVITFDIAFTGTLFIKPQTGKTSIPVTGLFATLTHNLSEYPQVQLDSSVMSILNDIKYIDENRLEISFLSEVDTTITLVAI